MTLPTVIQRRQQNAVEIIRRILLELLAGDRGLRHRLHQNARLEASACERSFRRRTSDERVLHVIQQIVADGAAQRVLGKGAVFLDRQRRVEIISQFFFKFVTKHHFASVLNPSFTSVASPSDTTPPLLAYDEESSLVRFVLGLFEI